MSLSEFLASLPEVIIHPDEGEGRLEIISYQPNMKGACYRHQNERCSGRFFGRDWQEVHEKMIEYLKLLEKFK